MTPVVYWDRVDAMGWVIVCIIAFIFAMRHMYLAGVARGRVLQKREDDDKLHDARYKSHNEGYNAGRAAGWSEARAHLLNAK